MRKGELEDHQYLTHPDPGAHPGHIRVHAAVLFAPCMSSAARNNPGLRARIDCGWSLSGLIRHLCFQLGLLHTFKTDLREDLDPGAKRTTAQG